MASVEEVRAGIGQANDKISEALGALQNAISSLEQAEGMLLRVTEGSTQADVSEANGLLAQAKEAAGTAQTTAQAAIQASEGIANRL